MILGMKPYTFVHVVISLIGIVTGLLVIPGLLMGQRQDVLTAIFLITTFLTSATGFGFPFERFLPSHAVGTALMLQTSMGFLLTTLTIQLVPPVVDTVGWQWAFPLLAVGPAAGIAAIRRLLTLKALQGSGNMKPDSAAPPLPSTTT